MNKSEFLEFCGRLYDLAQGAGPSASGSGDGRSPKYDTALYGPNGLVSYASECSAKELRYQIGRAEQPPKDSKYAEKNAKQAKALRFFLAWREANPNALWTGERNRVTITAKAPLDKPERYARDALPEQDSAPAPSFDDDQPDDDIPF